jgi:hypothetical protein
MAGRLRGRSQTLFVKKHAATCAGFVFKIAAFAGSEIFSAGIAPAPAAPILHPK